MLICSSVFFGVRRSSRLNTRVFATRVAEISGKASAPEWIEDSAAGLFVS